MKYGFIILLLFIFVPFLHATATTPLHYTYVVDQNRSNNDFILSITIHNNLTIYGMSVSITNANYTMHAGLQANTFYTYLPSNPAGKVITVRLTTSEGLIQFSFKTPKTTTGIGMIGLFLSFSVLLGLLGLLGFISFKYRNYFTTKTPKAIIFGTDTDTETKTEAQTELLLTKAKQQKLEQLHSDTSEEQIVAKPIEYKKAHVEEYCPNCKEEIVTGSKFCNECGYQLVRCQICKKILSEVEYACPTCHNPFHKTHWLEYYKIKGTCPICNT